MEMRASGASRWLLGGLGLLAASCILPFDDYDPRLTGAGGSATTSTAMATGGSGGTQGSGGSGGGMGGSGGAGGAEPIVHCNELRKLERAPVIDGIVEPGMFLEEVDPVGWKVCSNCPRTFPSGHGTRYAAAWFDDGLYWYLELTDPDRNPADPGDEAWMGDGLELYIDHDAVFASSGSYDNPGTIQIVMAAPPDDGSDSSRAARYRPSEAFTTWTSSEWIATPTTTGYVVEAMIVAADLDLASWTPTAGQNVGIDLSHNVSLPVGDNGTEGNRHGQYFLQIGPTPLTGEDYPYINSGVFCTPELLP
jgi:hypothetical protein